MSSDFSANAQALGYLYQVRYALLLLLQANPEVSISIEKLDDIAFETNGTPLELIQTKHHVTKKGSLSNSSTDLWKTLRVWSEAFKADYLRFKDTKFILVTTDIAPDGSAPSKLYPNGDRDVKGALEILNSIADNSINEGNRKAYGAFKSLSEQEKERLLRNVFIVDASPSIVDTKSKICDVLRYSVRPHFLEGVYERLEGFWFNKVIEHLMYDNISIIPTMEIQDFIYDLQDQFHVENLPIDFYDIDTPLESDLSEEQKIFVEQLKLVMVSDSRIKKAISDYHKAFTQRSQWIRDELVMVGELEKYESRLIDEWERQFLIMKENLDENPELSEEVAGRQLFNWVDQNANIHIRPRCTEPYVMRGSYHILANILKVGWHNDFVTRLRDMYENAKKVSM